MTFISAIIAKQGIILSADSKELIQGGQLLWKDFDEILKLKNTTENETTECISPKDITDKFKANAQLTNGRVKSIDGARKIYQLGTHSAILLSGVANPGGQDFPIIIRKIKDLIEESSDKSFANILNITYSIIESLITTDTSEDTHQSEYLICGFDEQEEKFKVFKFRFQYKYKFDETGSLEKDANGKNVGDFVFERNDSSVLLSTSGWTKYVGELGSINQEKLEIELLQAFELSKRIMDLVVTIENISNEIRGIGGKIYYAAITEKGFFWVNTEADVMNLLV